MPQEFEFGPLEWPVGFHFPSGGKPTKRKPPPLPPKKPKPPPTPPEPPIPIPIYVSVVAHNISPSGPGVAAVFALTPAAIAAGCTVVLSQSERNVVFHEYASIVVIAVPAGTPAGNLFTMTTSGTRVISPGAPPAYFCGTYTFTQDYVPTGNTVGPPTLYEYLGTWSYSDPNGIVSSGSGTNWDSSPNGEFHVSTVEHFWSQYDGGGNVINSGIPCSVPIPPGDEIFSEPIDLEWQVNAQAGHVVSPVVWPYSTTDAVRKPPFFGNATAFWYGAPVGGSPDNVHGNCFDGLTTFYLRSNRWSTITTDVVPLIYISGTNTGIIRYDDFGPFGRVLSPLPNGVAPNYDPWNTLTYGQYPLFKGSALPIVTFDPLTNPP